MACRGILTQCLSLLQHPHGHPAHAEIFKYIMTLWFEDEAAKRKVLVKGGKENDDSIHEEDSTK